MSPTDITMHELADELNVEPPVLFGCNASEVVFIMTVSPLLALPILVLTWVLTDFFVAVLIFALCLATFVYAVLRYIQRLKNGRPDGYYLTQLLVLKRKYWPDGSLVNISSRWDNRRSLS